MGIGGEYAAINSAIDEMIPASSGQDDLAVNGTYWAGAILGTIVTLFVLNHVEAFWGWRIAYIVGPLLALSIIYVRRNLPESPRWQIMHGREAAAEASMREIEDDVAATKGALRRWTERELEIRPTDQIGYLALLRTLFPHYPGRATLVSALMITQSFLYNASSSPTAWSLSSSSTSRPPTAPTTSSRSPRVTWPARLRSAICSTPSAGRR